MMSEKRERRRSSRTAPTSLEIRERWPLHWLVWEGKDAELEGALKEDSVSDSRYWQQTLPSKYGGLAFQYDCEQLDPRGRTPLHLAVALAKVRCAEVLLQNGANTLALNRHDWNGKG